MPAATNVLAPAATPVAGATPAPTGATDLFAALLAGGVTPEGGGDGAPADAVQVTGELAAPAMDDGKDADGDDAVVLLPLLDQQMLMQPQVVPLPATVPVPAPAPAAAAVAVEAQSGVASPVSAVQTSVGVKHGAVSRTLPASKSQHAPAAREDIAPAAEPKPAATIRAEQPAPGQPGKASVSRHSSPARDKEAESGTQPVPIQIAAEPHSIAEAAPTRIVAAPVAARVSSTARLTAPEDSSVEQSVSEVAAGTRAVAAAPQRQAVTRDGWKPAARGVAPAVTTAEEAPNPHRAAPAPQMVGRTSADTTWQPVDRLVDPAPVGDTPPRATPDAAKPIVSPTDTVKPISAPSDSLISAAPPAAASAQPVHVAPTIDEALAAPEPPAVSPEEGLAVELTAGQPARRAAMPRAVVMPQQASLLTSAAEITSTPSEPVMRAIEPAIADAANAEPVAATPAQPGVAPAKPDAPVTAPVQPTITAALNEKVLDLGKNLRWIDQLARDIAAAGDSDRTMRFRLAPERLGALRVEITQSNEGAHVRLHASSEAAQQVLADAQPRLVAEARAQGVRIADSQVSFSSNGSDAQQQDDARQRAPSTQQDVPFRAIRKSQSIPATAAAPERRRSDRYA